MRWYKMVPSRVTAWVLSCALCGLAAAAAQAAPAAAPDWNSYEDSIQSGIGVHYGQLGGHGLAFRLPVRWWLYLQVAGGIWHSSENKKHNVGVNLNYILRQDQRLRLFVSGGTAFYYHRRGPVVDESWNFGAGVGVEYLQGARWSWKVEADFAYLGKNGDIKVVPQAGLTYYW